MTGAGAGCGAKTGCCELVVRVVETGCQCWGPGAGAGCACGGDWVPVLGAVSWLCAWWKQGSGAGCWCWPRVAETGCGCCVPVLGGGDRVLGKVANCGAVDFWSQHGCARSHSKAVDDGALRERLYALMAEDDVILGFVVVSRRAG